MSALLRTCLTALAMALALPALAQTAGKFDGTYTGLASTTGDTRGQCPQMETPAALTVGNGAVQSASGSFSGNVDPTGHVVLHSKAALRFEGQVDAAGVIKVMGSSTHGCSYTFSWKKR